MFSSPIVNEARVYGTATVSGVLPQMSAKAPWLAIMRANVAIMVPPSPPGTAGRTKAR